MPVNQICPNCKNTSNQRLFYYAPSVPVHSVVLLNSHTAALQFPTGDIALALCDACGFIFNAAFDPNLHNYAHNYEATQAYSLTFNAFHRQLAARLIEQYGLHNKQVIEIGCGQGEFLDLLCQMGSNRGLGFDPAFDPARRANPANQNFTIIKDFYSEKYANHRADFVCCKMTLEHIHKTADFVGTVRRAVGDNPNTVIFFQVPDVTRILHEAAFWDIYYEHCSYFSPTSLAYLLQRSGFDVINQTTAYDDQYLMIEARPGIGNRRADALDNNGERQVVQQNVTRFIEKVQRKLDGWREKIVHFKQQGQRVVIWGAGSKGVAFLTTLGLQQEIEYAVDINPNKHGTYMAGAGQAIVPPEFLQTYRPHTVLVMNPIYRDEIKQQLDHMELAATLILVE